MIITTTRLTLQHVLVQDLENIHSLHSLPEVDEFNTLGIPSSINETEKILTTWINAFSTNENFVFSVTDVATKQFIGLFGIKMGKPSYRLAEIWYKFHPASWNKGFATEATKAVLKFCFNELKLHRVEAGCATGNTASVKVLEKAGFTREGQTRKLLPIRGEWHDNYFYAILEEDHKP